MTLTKTTKPIIFVTLIAILLTPMVTSINILPPAHASSHPNLFVSAENSQYSNYFSGPQVIEVVVADPDINQLNQNYGEPIVTVNGKRLHMFQATDGNWYAYFADSKQAQIADSTQGDTGKGLDFGRFCSASSGITATGIDFSETKGIATAESAPGSVNGSASPSATISASCTGLVNGAATSMITGASLLNDVVRENKTLNTNAPSNKIGQIGGSTSSQIQALESAWPIIQLYDFSAFPTSVVIDYQKSGGDQTVNLTFDRLPVSLDSISLGGVYAPRDQVPITINDHALNIDPTDFDSWTWGASTANNTVYYQAFDRNGQPNADGTTGMQNLATSLTSLMFSNNGKLTLDPAANGTTITRLVSNNIQALNSNGASLSISATDLPVTFLETTKNSGVFVNNDTIGIANINILADPTDANRGKSAVIKYNSVSKKIQESNSAITSTKSSLLADLVDANNLVQQDKLMDAADRLVNTSSNVYNNVSSPDKEKILGLLAGTIYSYMIASVPGSVHDYPVTCGSHEIKVTTSYSSTHLVFGYSSSTQIEPSLVNKTIDKVCIPYLIRGATISSEELDTGKLTLNLSPSPTCHTSNTIFPQASDCFVILALDRSLLDSKDNTGSDTQFNSVIDGAQKTHRENNTATTRLLSIPFQSNAQKIEITPNPTQPVKANAGPDQVVRPGTIVTLDGSASTGDKITYSWTQTSGDPVTLLFKNTAHPTFIAPQVILGQQKVLTFELTIINQAGQAYTDTVQVTVRPLTASPITVFTDKQLYTVGDVIQIYGSVNPTSSGVPVTLKIISQSNNIVTVGQVSVSKNGDYTFQVRSGGLVQSGTFTVMVQYGDPKITASTTFIVASSTGAPLKPLFSQDGNTVVTLSTSYVTKYQPLTIALKFANSAGVNIQHQNYELTVKQAGQEVFTKKNIHTNTGEDILVTTPLTSSEPVDIEIKLKGVGLPTNQSNWTGTKNETLIATQIVPEFGPISFMILIVSFASIVLVLRFNKRIQI